MEKKWLAGAALLVLGAAAGYGVVRAARMIAAYEITDEELQRVPVPEEGRSV